MRILVLCSDAWHPAETARRGFAPLEKSGFELEWLEDGVAWSAARMMEFPLVILAKSNVISPADKNPWLTPDSQTGFQTYLRAGNGLVIVHSGISGYDQLPAMRGVIGGAFLRHPPKCAVTVEPKIPHALTCGVAPFAVRDEQYFIALDDAAADVFLHTHSEHGTQPAGWTRREGSGRICVLTPGHDAEVRLHLGFQMLLNNALRWAAKKN
ncbi:MAG: ThuA domain-containing protein [Limisphaerales bacterium]